jgi:hypothetical protein
MKFRTELRGEIVPKALCSRRVFFPQDPADTRRSFPVGEEHQREANEYLDGSINIFYQGKKLKHKPISKKRIKSFSCVIEQKEMKLVTMNY